MEFLISNLESIISGLVSGLIGGIIGGSMVISLKFKKTTNKNKTNKNNKSFFNFSSNVKQEIK